ncbi:hypothetical protein M6B38_360760 [Iris pallida]|uniref:Uncharacterized protein n=1 Tax=Iris pallida TaxID=29817 RepID=A0AAX6GK96_IRIPA|nr:hypothetical protein M6B38_360760 [Iris pallida]
MFVSVSFGAVCVRDLVPFVSHSCVQVRVSVACQGYDGLWQPGSSLTDFGRAFSLVFLEELVVYLFFNKALLYN